MKMHSNPDSGEVPKGWKVLCLGDVADVTKLAGYEFTKHFDYIDDGEIIAIRSLNVVDGQLDLSSVKRISKEASDELPRSKLFKNDLLLTYTGSKLGDTALIDVNEKYHLAPNVCRLRANEESDSYFLYVYLRSKVFSSLLNTYKVGSGQPTVPMKNIRKIPIPWPPSAERVNIAKIFSCLNNKVELNHRTNQTLEQIAQTLFKSWFVDFDPVRAKVAVREHFERRAAEHGEPLPEPAALEEAQNIAAAATIAGLGFDPTDIDGTRALVEAKLAGMEAEQRDQLRQLAAAFPSDFEETPLGKAPAGWQVKPLDAIAKYQNGLALQKFRPENENEFLPVLKIAQLKKGYTDGVEKASPNIKESCRVYDGDVIFSWSGSLVVDVWCGGNAALNQHLFKVTSKEYPKWFFYQFTKHYLCEFQRIAAAKAVTMGHIKREHLREALCAVPPNDFIDRVNSTFTSQLEKRVSLRLESRTLAGIRDQLLPRLLSGEIQLNPEPVAEAS